VPLVLMETLSLWLVFGHGVFSPPNNAPSKNAVLYIMGLVLFSLVHIYTFEMKEEKEEGCATEGKISADDECPIPYCNSISDSDPSVDKTEAALGNERDALLEYNVCLDGGRGSGEDVDLEIVPLSRQQIVDYQSVVNDGNAKDDSTSGQMPCHHSCSTDNCTTFAIESQDCLEHSHTGVDSKHDNEVVIPFDCIQILKEASPAIKKYVSVLQFPFEVLVMCCMFTFLKSSIPICKRLWPIFTKEFIGVHSRWYFILIGAGVSIIVGAFLWCLHGSSKTKSSNVHIGLYTGESVRTTIHSLLYDGNFR